MCYSDYNFISGGVTVRNSDFHPIFKQNQPLLRPWKAGCDSITHSDIPSSLYNADFLSHHMALSTYATDTLAVKDNYPIHFNEKYTSIPSKHFTAVPKISIRHLVQYRPEA